MLLKFFSILGHPFVTSVRTGGSGVVKNRFKMWTDVNIYKRGVGE